MRFVAKLFCVRGLGSQPSLTWIQAAEGAAVRPRVGCAYSGRMESLAVRRAAPWSSALRRVDGAAVSTWALAGALVLYLGLDGGGYDIIVRNQVGIVLWWIVLVGAAWGVLPAARLGRLAWTALALFGAFVAWTALASTWSLSSERSLQELSRVACYLGGLLLALAIHRDRERAVRHTVTAVGAAVVVIAGVALVSRLSPDSFPSSHLTAQLLGGSEGRLGWPLNYWNGLAALVALGLPLLLSIATSARTVTGQAAAATAIPVLALCGYLTFSRGGGIASAVAALAFVILAPERLWKLATALVAGAGSAIVIGVAARRSAVVHGLTDHAAAVQGRQVLVALVLVCAVVAVGQVGIGLAARHATLPRLMRVPRRRAQILFATAVAVALVAALVAGAPSRLSRAWTDFKRPSGISQADLAGRFGSLSGNGRYYYWKVAIQATSDKRLTGSGPGTFQLLWQPRAPFYSPVINAHSLYIETLAEVGIIGLALLAGFLLVALGAALRLVARTASDPRTQAAGAAAALLAFMVSASFDWVWQLAVLPVAFLLLAAAVLAPSSDSLSARLDADGGAAVGRGVGGAGLWMMVRPGLIAVALACLVAIAFPLETAISVRQSQAAVGAGDTSLALSDALSAVRLEPGASSAHLQVALVLELEHDYEAALAAARRATADESQNWSNWLVLSRLEAETGHAKASLGDYRRARALDPRSPLFSNRE